MVKILILSVAMSTILFPPARAHAAEFCSDLFSLAEMRDFESIRGAWDAEAEMYQASKNHLGADDCLVSENMMRLSCRFKNSDQQAAITTQRALVNKILDCYGTQAQVASEEISRSHGRIMGGASTTLKAVAGNRMIDLRVGVGGYKYTGGRESWNTHLSIYAK